MTISKQPSLYITHGGGPCFWMEFPPPIGAHGFDRLRDYFLGLLDGLSQKPDAIVVVSAHWETSLPTIGSGEKPPMLYDYYGFPEHTFHLSYPAPGSPKLAEKIKGLLTDAGIESDMDAARGFDHGVFVPMMKINESAKIPVVMLSLQKNLDPEFHFKMGQALSPLRNENILIIGSGSSYHNLREYMDGRSEDPVAFDNWLCDAMTSPNGDVRKQKLVDWTSAPSARACHPRAEHLLPLMVAAGAGSDEKIVTRSFHDIIGNKPFSCFSFGQ